MPNTTKPTIERPIVVTSTSLIGVLLILAVLLSPVLTADGHTGAVNGLVAAASQQPLPTLAPVQAPPSVTDDPGTQPSPPSRPSAPPSVAGSPSPSPSPSTTGDDALVLPTVEQAQASDAAPEQGISLYGSITVRLWTCRAGYNPFGSGANLVADCVTPSRGEQFSLTAPGLGSTIDDRTGSMGTLTIDLLPADTYTLSHRPPYRTAYSIPVSCTTATPDQTATPPVNALAPTVTLVSISIPLAQGQAVVCDWYDVPQRRVVLPPQPRPSIGPVERAP